MIRHGTAIPIGAGATSRVYKVWDEALERWLAIKYLVNPDPLARARLLREARAMEGLSHPHVCPVLEVGEDDGRPYVLMPYLEGVTLGPALEQLPVESRLRLMAQVADAAHYAHEHGLLHRDLKPENVIVTDGDDGLPHAWVLDFGLVREIGAAGVTTTGEVLGTPSFMSPEQARGESTLDRRSDVFALGAMLYFALTGRPPFAAPSAAETLLRVMREDAPRLRSHRRDLPATLETIVSTALQKSPARRYESARAFAEDLRRYLAGSRPLARIPRSDAPRRLARRHPFAVAAAAALVLAGGLAAATALRMRGHAAALAREAAEVAATTEATRQSLRLEYLLPRHDIEPLRERAQAVIDLLRGSGVDPASRARNLRAAAQLQLDLGEVEAALPLLHAAAAALPDDAGLQRDAALAHARAYRAVLARLRPFADPGLRERHLAAARRDHVEPVRAIFGSVPGGAADPVAAAELAFAEGDIETALERLERAPVVGGTGYENWLAAADVRIARGVERHWSNRPEAAREDYDKADVLLGRALEHARSDPRAHRRRCELAALRMDALAEGIYPRGSLDDVAVHCRIALEVRPRDARLHAALAHLLAARAKQRRTLGEDVEALLAEAVASGERAHALDSRDPGVAQELALALMRLSTSLRWAGRTDRAPIERAAQVLAAIEADSASVDPLLIAGQVEGERAQVLERFGEDATAAYAGAIERMRTAVGRAPEAPFLRLNLANALSNLAYVKAQQGRPEVGLIRESIEQLRNVVTAQPQRASAWLSLANSHWDLAMALGWRGEDAGKEIAAADEMFARAADLDPDNLSIAYNRYNHALFVAAELLRQRRDANARLAEAAKLIDYIDARTESDWITPCPRAEYELRRFEAAAASGRFDRKARENALRLLGEGFRAQADDVDCARRRIELASMSLPFLDDDGRRSEREQAARLQAMHADAMEIHLAWAKVLAAELRGRQMRSEQAGELVGLVASLKQATGDNWTARLSPLEAALARSVE
jgi:serine/threonine-protein kinase